MHAHMQKNCISTTDSKAVRFIVARRSKTPDDYRRAELGKIHIAKKDLGLDDDTYQDVLWTICRVRSAADLDSQGRFKLIAHFKHLGWKPARAKRPQLDPQSRKIWSLWYQLKEAGLLASASAKSLRTEVKKLTGCDDLRFCDSEQRNLIIECLKKWLEREK